MNPATAFVVTVFAMLAAVGASLFSGLVEAAETPRVLTEDDGRMLLMGAFVLVGVMLILRARGEA